MKRFRVLVVDDEERIVNFLRSKLKAAGYDVFTATNGVEALEQLRAKELELVVLDLVMPKKDGFETLQEMRTFSTVPVIILSAKGADVDRIKGLTLGADDFLPKPFNPDELVARIEAVRRRVQLENRKKTTDVFTAGKLAIDFKRRKVTYEGQERHLTRIEFVLLEELARNAGKVMFYEDLLTRVWGPEYRNDVHLLRTCVSRLRQKLDDESEVSDLIRTIPRTGYIMEQPTD